MYHSLKSLSWLFVLLVLCTIYELALSRVDGAYFLNCYLLTILMMIYSFPQSVAGLGLFTLGLFRDVMTHKLLGSSAVLSLSSFFLSQLIASRKCTSLLTFILIYLGISFLKQISGIEYLTYNTFISAALNITLFFTVISRLLPCYEDPKSSTHYRFYD